MADMENFSELNQNFDTIKTLLNSIRAQGILNTSDVDKLLTGIYSKLEKINTEEDIDLIKIFLSELKQNLDERHGVLVSKFSAIESLFTNLLRNSAEMPKSADIKELFDIVATNLSVFSREVVSQKESLTDIALRLDAFRSDDSSKKDIIKNITLLKPDLERLNNGFDSIVLSLNDNFKTIIKTISAIDKTESLDKFADSFKDMELSTNTILSALQVIDKKAEQVESALQNLATKDDVLSTNKRIIDLTAQSHELKGSIDELSNKHVKFESLADKIDASVNIIVNLKTILEESDDANTKSILEQIKTLENQLETITSDKSFQEFKTSMENVLSTVIENTALLDKNLLATSNEIKNIETLLKGLDIGFEFNKLIIAINKVESDVKASINEVSQKLATLQDANIARVLNDISSEAEVLGSRINQTQSEMAILCEKHFNSVFENIHDIKNLMSQFDENSISANNAIFSSITDRLTIFENSLKESLDNQEKTLSVSSSHVAEQMENIKNISNVLDYKMDSSIVEFSNIKQNLTSLQTSLQNILALDFTNAVKELRVDLYASKQELANAFDSSTNDMSENILTDMYAKYELLVSKLDYVEDELKKSQTESLEDLKGVLEKISNSIIDVLSYVSESKDTDIEYFGSKISEIAEIVKENSLSHVENIRSIVDVIKIQVENSLNKFSEDSSQQIDTIKSAISENTEDIKKELKYSYSKLLELQDSYQEIKEILNVNEINTMNKFDNVISITEGVNSEFKDKLSILKNSLLENITNFKQEFITQSLDNVKELQLSAEGIHNKTSQEIMSLIEASKLEFKTLSTENKNSNANALTKILENLNGIKDLINSSNKDASNNLALKVESILEEFALLKEMFNNFDENIDADMTRQLSILESNFESLVSQITILFDKSDKTLTDKINVEFASISDEMQNFITVKLEDYKQKIEETIDNLSNNTTAQSDFVQSKINNLKDSLNELWEKQIDANNQQIEEVTLNIKSILDDNIKLTAADYLALKNKLAEFTKNLETNNQSLMQEIKQQFISVNNLLNSVAEEHSKDSVLRNEEIKSLINNNSAELIDSTSEINNQLKQNIEISQDTNSKLIELAQEVNVNKELVENISEQTSSLQTKVDDGNETLLATSKQIENNTHLLSNEVATIKTELTSLNQVVTSNTTLISDVENSLVQKLSGLNQVSANIENNNTLITTVQSTLLQRLEELSSISSMVDSNNSHITNVENVLSEQLNDLQTTAVESSEKELQAINNLISNITAQLEAEKKQIQLCKDLIIDFSKNELNIISGNIEKETDIIITELIEQFDILQKSQNDNVINITSRIEEFINAHLYNQIEDLKSYFDIKADNSVVNSKLDNIKNEITSSVDVLIENLNKLLDSNLFTTAMSDFKVASELFITTAVDGMNSRLDLFIKENNNNLNENFSLLDKKFIDTLVNKTEEIKIISNKYNDSFAGIQKNLTEQLLAFKDVKDSLNNKINELSSLLKTSTESTNHEVKSLQKSFENLRAQISSKSFDEAFQASINKQIANLETLVTEQLGYIEDINALCVSNLPDITELNVLLKHSVLESINKFSAKLDTDIITSIDNRFKAQNLEEKLKLVKTDLVEAFSGQINSLKIENNLKTLKTDLIEHLSNDINSQEIETLFNELKTEIITQFINIFNQISFIAEQEEIIDFIQEKHDDLITILSHIVTTSAGINDIKDNVSVVDNKIDELKDDINLINEKITAIMTSDGDINYVYSLQDLESDIANLRLALNDIKESSHKQNFEELISSTNDIYDLVEKLKTELPTKNEFNIITEDIESISTRTNKLILASDESYKTLQDNLHDFKLVINDLDERTRNFAEEAGINKIDSKLNAINNMVQNGAKSNQIFNQIFEYLAEWVDKAGVQINAISNKVETLEDIGQIKLMLADLKAGAEDNSENIELIEALTMVFDKQARKISSLETKLDKIIVETTINNKNNTLDITPFENTFNKFLVALDEKMSMQQAKIHSLETMLGNVMDLLDEKDTSALSKKVGGMDRQIAKLNKNIEKIASHVIEK